MTEAYEDEWVVVVRAQVMSRDETTCGWVGLGGGGLAIVTLGRRPKTSGPKRTSGHMHSTDSSSTDDSISRYTHVPSYEYYIDGKRISDQLVVLACTIKKDFQYNKVMPTFHHWVTDEKRFGLTFQTAADARAFDRGVRRAVQDLLDGRGGAWPSLHKYNKNNLAPKDDDEEGNIFECLNLPSDSRSSSENSTSSRPTRRSEQTPILSAITLPSRSARSNESLPNTELVLNPRLPGSCLDTEKMPYVDDGVDSDNFPYVNITSMHEFPYSGMGSDEKVKADQQRDKETNTTTTVTDKKHLKQDVIQARVKCRHCHEWYLESANGAGACEFAPDCFKTCIDTISCIKCAQCMLYHCMSDSEGDFTSHPCACAPPETACAKRWLGMGLLSLLVPCLWCYAPLRCLHRAARHCRVAGGEHAPRVVPHT